MLTFLRKIRKSLIESGSTRKYLLYAIGEIALVVIGILIALQINNYNDQRKRQIEKEAILAQLQIDLKESLIELEKMKEFHLEKAQASAKITQAFWIDEVSLDAFRRNYNRPLSNKKYSPTLGTARSLINSGNINLLNSVELKNGIISYIEKVESRLEDIQRYEETYYRKGVDIAREAVPNTFRSLEEYQNRSISKRRQNSINLGVNTIPEKIVMVPFKSDIRDILKDKNIYRAYDFLNLAHRNVYFMYNEILELTEELLILIEHQND